ncbi:ABC transporter ATP-binding protein [Nitratidesulfovibrio sp. SRB-5]|uniref:ABC transporter ATP-binding protein n=1 Tax=Nitratidesulfovibrio sp. SRB-5 TaxID=2872636 RepID=UPI001025752C|nr:ABC transporter ATP-binding protein [Nitratidesulfovibrio sp. SRB-5]MBZ2172256.1 ABC transporter ATP-binding protein [Nitratidesulfovibrio sp. SRB-5]RXF77217.1 ABC transporter ATP-binding protein [Desulfovibrio sp. DS-1]
MADITLAGIGKAYGAHAVLDGLSLTVNHGECFTLLGPSGCGKTVLLRLIAGFETPDAGTISIGGEPVSDAVTGDCVPPDARDLGVVFQDYAVWPHMSVADNIGYPLKLAGLPAAERTRRVLETVEMVNLTGLENRMPSQLSGGQQQRVALARALVGRPSLMLLDEPLCNLDANLREEMRFEIKELQRTLGITILYVTHDQEIALAISDRLAIMDHAGAIRQVGTPWEIFERPADEFVFRFMGVANFLPARRRGMAMLAAGGEQPVPWGPPDGDAEHWMAGFRPSDVRLARQGDGLRGTVRRASFLGAMTDYLIEVDGASFRTQLDTHEALARGLMFAEGEPCVVGFHDLHWFDAATVAAQAPQGGE